MPIRKRLNKSVRRCSGAPMHHVSNVAAPITSYNRVQAVHTLSVVVRPGVQSRLVRQRKSRPVSSSDTNMGTKVISGPLRRRCPPLRVWPTNLERRQPLQATNTSARALHYQSRRHTERIRNGVDSTLIPVGTKPVQCNCKLLFQWQLGDAATRLEYLPCMAT